MRKFIEKLMSWLYHYFVGVILIQSFIIFMSWLYGYWSMGLNSGKFDLNSCGSALAAVAASAATGWGKWVVDSWKNSPQGEMPKINGGD